jgi:hypothetical protein
MTQKWTAAKFWVAFVYAMAISAVQMGVFHGTVLKWVTVSLALLGSASVYLWPNKLVETDTKDSGTVTNP